MIRCHKRLRKCRIGRMISYRIARDTCIYPSFKTMSSKLWDFWGFVVFWSTFIIFHISCLSWIAWAIQSVFDDHEISKRRNFFFGCYKNSWTSLPTDSISQINKPFPCSSDRIGYSMYCRTHNQDQKKQK